MTEFELKNSIRDKVALLADEKAIGTHAIHATHLLLCMQKVDEKSTWKIEYKKDIQAKKYIFVLSNRTEKLTITPFNSITTANERILSKIYTLLNITE